MSAHDPDTRMGRTKAPQTVTVGVSTDNNASNSSWKRKRCDSSSCINESCVPIASQPFNPYNQKPPFEQL